VSQFFGCRPLGPLGWAVGLAAAIPASLAAPVMVGLPAIEVAAEKLGHSLQSAPDAGP
jgi:hypothetical protein